MQEWPDTDLPGEQLVREYSRDFPCIRRFATSAQRHRGYLRESLRDYLTGLWEYRWHLRKYAQHYADSDQPKSLAIPNEIAIVDEMLAELRLLLGTSEDAMDRDMEAVMARAHPPPPNEAREA